MKTGKIYEEEKKYLLEIISLINLKIEVANKRFNTEQHTRIGFTEGLRGTQFNRQSMMSMYATEITKLEKIVKKPYFGNFQFTNEKTGKTEKIYVGMNNLTDNDMKLVVYDWRSNLCSLYYDYNIGEKGAHYLENNEKIFGTIDSKRKIQIENSNFVDVIDQDTLGDDEILIKYLSENFDSRLKSIVATIQKQQNQIIRNNYTNNYIVQGVAGSGKTTVALHRIAYLLYNDTKKNSDSDYLIIGPNNFFLDYISSLLPDLDIGGVSQSAFEDLGKKLVSNKNRLIGKNEILEKILNKEISEETIEFKSSIEYMELVKKFVELFISDKLKDGFKYEGVTLCSSESLSRITDPLIKGSYKEKINNYINLFSKKIREEHDDICSKVLKQKRDEYKEYLQDNYKKEEMIKAYEEIKKNINEGCKKQLKEFFCFVNISPLLIYFSFIENLEKFANFDAKIIKEETMDNLNKNEICPTDMTALILIQHMLGRNDNYLNYSNIFIDEGQDLSCAQYYVLTEIFKNCKFNVFGDINQSIFGKQSISNWEELSDKIFVGNVKYIELNKGYRTTSEISDLSNVILESLNQNYAESLSRSGGQVSINNICVENTVAQKLQEINSFIEKGYKSIAIICKNSKETEELYKKLQKAKLNINLITKDSDKYSDGLCILPVYLAKGLEFDAVIINDASDNIYTDNDMDKKLLYVASTRALHELNIDYSDNLTKILSGREKVKSLGNK